MNPAPLQRLLPAHARSWFAAAVMSSFATGYALAQQSIFLEAEALQFSGDWIVETGDGASGTGNLLSIGADNVNDAATVITIPAAGTYNLWVRARDFDTFSGQRRFQAGFDGTLFPFEAGAHGVNGWVWQNVGARALSAGTHLLNLHDVTKFFARCDAIFLTTEATDPTTLTSAQLAAFTTAVTPTAYRSIDCGSGLMLRFSSAAETAANLRPLVNATALSCHPTDGGVLRYAPSSAALATAVIDTTASDGTLTSNTFRNCTVTLDVRFGNAQQTLGIFSRVPASEDNAFLALVNCDENVTTLSDRYRLFNSANNPKSSTVGTTLLNDVSNNLTPGVWYTLRLNIRNNGPTNTLFTLDLLDRATGALILSKTATSTSGALFSAGEIGLRFFSSQGAGTLLDVDNLSVVENDPGAAPGGARTVAATLAGPDTRTVFYSQPDINGDPLITRETELLVGGTWTPVPIAAGAERLFLLYRPAVSADTSGVFFPKWSQRVDFDFGGVVQQTGFFSEDPFIAGQNETLLPRACQQIDPRTVSITCAAVSGRTATATWQLGNSNRDCKVTLAFTADRTGDYSFGFAPFEASDQTQTTFHLLPPLYQFQRIPSAPRLLTSSVTPQPLALVQKTPAGFAQPVTFGVAADPAASPFEWPTARNATSGFSLLNTDGKVQPVMFTPVLGLAGSHLEKGGDASATFRVLLQGGEWRAAVEYLSNNVFDVTDYRQPYVGSSRVDLQACKLEYSIVSPK